MTHRRAPCASLTPLLALLLALGPWHALPAAAQADGATDPRPVVVIPIEGIIDLGLAGFVDRSVRLAEAADARLIVLEIETFGGRVDAAVKIRDTLLRTTVPTAAYVNPRAVSAGALLSFACDTIYMAGGGTIGAASPVAISPGGQSEGLGEKEVSYVRTEFRATAEQNGYPPLVAEAMVDKDATVAVFQLPDGPKVVAVPEIERVAASLGLTADDAKTYSAEGKLLSLTTSDALEIGLARARTDTLEELLEVAGVVGARVQRLQTTWSEDLVRILTHPVLSGLLLSLGMIGLFVELRSPGWGLPGTLGVVALMLFFGAQYLVGLAEWQEVLLLAIGLSLLLLELFVIPGFGVAGFTGIACLIAAIYLALVEVPIPQYSWELKQFGSATTTVSTALLTTIGLGVAVMKYLPKTTFGRQFMLETELLTEAGYTGVKTGGMPAVGTVGTAFTALRPAGRVQIGDRLVDAQTQGDFIERDTPVRVVKIVGNAVVVETVREDAHV